MPLINQESLKAFLAENHFAVKGATIAGHTDAVKECEDIVFQKTRIPIPQRIEDAIPTLQFIAHNIYVWILKGKEDSQKEGEEYDRYRSSYKDAMKMLDEIQEGTLKIYDRSGNLVSAPKNAKSYHVSNCNRSERL